MNADENRYKTCKDFRTLKNSRTAPEDAGQSGRYKIKNNYKFKGDGNCAGPAPRDGNCKFNGGIGDARLKAEVALRQSGRY
jgi:hypothetical protein